MIFKVLPCLTVYELQFGPLNKLEFGYFFPIFLPSLSSAVTVLNSKRLKADTMLSLRTDN